VKMNKEEQLIKKGIMSLEDKDLVNYVVDNFTAARDARKEYEDIWQQAQDIYNCKPEKVKEKGKSNLFIPETTSAVETMVARLAAPFYNLTDNPISTVPLKSEPKELIEKIDITLTQDLHDMRFPEVNEIDARQFLIMGTSIRKLLWNTEEDRPFASVLDVFDFFVDPEAMEIEDARFCIHRKYLSLQELYDKQQEGIYKNVDGLVGSSAFENTNPERFNDEDKIINDSIKRDIEILEYWENDYVCVVADRRVLLNKRINPFIKPNGEGFKPFLKSCYITKPFKFYGVGVPELVAPLQLELNAKRNDRINNVNIILNKMWLVQRGMVDDLKQLKSTAGGLVICNDINGVKPMDMPDVTSSSYQEENLIKVDIANATGINDYIRGSRPEQRESATAVQLKTENSLNKLDYTYRIFVERGLKDMCQAFLIMRQRFMAYPKLINKFNNDNHETWQYLEPDEIQGEFNIIINPDPLGINETQQIQKIQMAIQLAMQVGYNPQPIADYALKKLGVDEVMLNEMKLQAKQEAMMMQQMQEEQLQQQQAQAEQQQIEEAMREQGLQTAGSMPEKTYNTEG
jgi:hypothetical protein